MSVSVAERDLGRTAAGASQGLSWHGVDLVGCETSHCELQSSVAGIQLDSVQWEFQDSKMEHILWGYSFIKWPLISWNVFDFDPEPFRNEPLGFLREFWPSLGQVFKGGHGMAVLLVKS